MFQRQMNSAGTQAQLDRAFQFDYVYSSLFVLGALETNISLVGYTSSARVMKNYPEKAAELKGLVWAMRQ
ncbi:hypothetical protein FRC02_003001 [Tulasnella sp. 418]|nr:hypothetical protein FRC02_003001 [Tulasnella sp. 418]